MNGTAKTIIFLQRVNRALYRGQVHALTSPSIAPEERIARALKRQRSIRQTHQRIEWMRQEASQ